MGLIQDFLSFTENRYKFNAWLAEQRPGWRKILVPPEEAWQYGTPVEWNVVFDKIKSLGVPGINAKTVFSNVDGTYMLYPEHMIVKALSEMPKPLYTYHLEYMDCDDIAEWDKLILKQILLSCPVAYMEGYKPNYGHAFLLILHQTGCIWRNISESDIMSLEQVTFCRI